MKLIFLLLAFFIAFGASAQNQLKVTDNSVVKDSTGLIYPAAIWKALVRKGSYTLKPEDPANSQTAFYLIRLSEDEVEQRFAQLPKPTESRSFRNGQKVKLPNLFDINGNKLDFKDVEGKIVVLNFWFINCPPCRMEIPDLNELVAEFKTNKYVVFVGIALDDKAALKNFLKTSPFDYAIIDNGRYIASTYNVKSFPTHAIIDTKGKVYFHTAGLAIHTVWWLKKSIKELLATSETNVAGR
jgi:thiol-disulfide isomerase/thioredoxin